MFCNTLRAAGGGQDITPVLLALSWKVLLTLPGSAPGDTPPLHSATAATDAGDVPGQ